MSHVLVKKTDYAFIKALLAIMAVSAAVVFVFFKIFQEGYLYAGFVIHKTRDICGCSNMSEFFSMHPFVFSSMIILGVVGSAYVSYSLFKLAKLILSTKKFISHYLSLASERHSFKLNSAIKNLNLDAQKIIEVKSDEPVVFCFGFLHPKICISRAVVRLLNTYELQAVLSHEACHMKSYEPLKLFIVKYFQSIFFFMPIIGAYAKNYIVLSEMAADEKASGDAGARSNLASAIEKIFQYGEQEQLKKILALSFFSSVIFERARRLSDKSYAPKPGFSNRGLAASALVIISAFFIIFNFLASSTKAFEMHNAGNCLINDGVKEELICPAMSGENALCGRDNYSFKE